MSGSSVIVAVNALALKRLRRPEVPGQAKGRAGRRGERQPARLEISRPLNTSNTMQPSRATDQSFQVPSHSRFGVPCTSQTMSQIKLATRGYPAETDSILSVWSLPATRTGIGARRASSELTLPRISRPTGPSPREPTTSRS